MYEWTWWKEIKSYVPETFGILPNEVFFLFFYKLLYFMMSLYFEQQDT